MAISPKNIAAWQSSENTSKLEKALEDKSFDIRLMAIQALVELQSKSSVDTIKLRLEDNVGVVKEAALEALLSLGVSETMAAELHQLQKAWKEKAEQMEKYRLKKKKEEELADAKRTAALMQDISLAAVQSEARQIQHKNKQGFYTAAIVIGLFAAFGGIIPKWLGVY